MINRVFLIVADSLGIGCADDAHKFYNGDSTDENSNTYKSLALSGYLKADFLSKLGIGNIDGVNINRVDSPIAAFGRLKEKSAGKDTVTGHWELCGIVLDKPMPTFPYGFPDEFIERFSKAVGRECICNMPYSGTEVIKVYGKEHIETGKLIVYTSSDSVFQIAAHEDVVPVETLYEYCETAREMLSGELAVGRVIARPFVGDDNKFTRTSNRRDFALKPPKKTLCDAVKANGMDVIAVGKIGDIFAHVGITEEIHTTDNDDGLNVTIDLLNRNFKGLCFVNLVDFDMKYGHRRNVKGYVEAVNHFDTQLEYIASQLKDDDVLIVTADHGCDPAFYGTDHTREDVPVLVYGKTVKNVNIGTRYSFADLGKTVCDMLDINGTALEGESFVDKIM